MASTISETREISISDSIKNKKILKVKADGKSFTFTMYYDSGGRESVMSNITENISFNDAYSLFEFMKKYFLNPLNSNE